MSILSFFRFLKQNKTQPLKVDPNEFIPTLWEDDYCQIEIVPSENISFIVKESAEINKLAQKSRSIFGFTETFERSPIKFPTLSKEIRAHYFEHTLSENKLPIIKHIKYQTSKIIDCSNSSTKAYGFFNFVIFFETESEFVKHIWLSTGLIVDMRQVDLLKNFLYNLGEENDFILINWNSLELVDLRNRNEIEEYLMKSFK